MGISKFLGTIFTSKTHDPFAGSEARSFAAKPASQHLPPSRSTSQQSGNRTFIVKTSVKGVLSETHKSEPVSLEEAIKTAVTFVNSAPQDFLEVSAEEWAVRCREASVSIIDAQSGESFAYLRACDEDMSLVHCLGTSSTSYFGRKSMPFISPTYRYADVFKGAGQFADSARDEAFSDSDSEFAVFHRWEGMYPGHVSY